MSKVVVLNGQSLFDIALQEFGTVEAVFDIALLNELSVTDSLDAGTELSLPSSTDTDELILKHYKKNNIKPATNG